MPRFEFVEGTSSKFWEITLEDGDTVRTRWGRIGTEGQDKEESFEDRAAALVAYQSAIFEKVGKGYRQVLDGGGVAGASNPDFEAKIEKDPDAEATYLKYGEWLRAQKDVRGELLAMQADKEGKQSAAVDTFIEKHAEALLGPLAEYKEYLELTWRLGFIDSARLHLDYDSDVDAEKNILPALFHSASGRFLRELTLGSIGNDGEMDFGDAIKVIAKQAPKTLTKLFIGDFTYEDCELSWSHLGNAEPLWSALPQLEWVKLRAGSMTLGKIDLPACRTFIVETGGLSRASMKSIAQAKWPKLEALEIWFGDENYGAECDVKDVQPVLEGKGLSKLKRLGLRNCEFTGELVKVLPDAKILPQLEELDLSKGVLIDEDVEALIANKAAYAHLKNLDLSENLLGETEKLEKALKNVDVSGQRDHDDPEHRYVAVGE